MTTLAELDKESNGTFIPFEDAAFPSGHFGVTAFIDGFLVGYLLEGKLDDPDSVVKGRIEWGKEDDRLVRYAYAQGGVTGGVPLGEVTDFNETLAKMV